MADDIKVYSQNYLATPYATGTASSEAANHEIELSFDRDRFTFYQGTIAGLTIVYYLGPTARRINSVLYNWNLAGATLEYSTDGVSYSSAGSISGLTATAGIASMSDVSAKYIRLSAMTAQGAGANAIIYQIGFVYSQLYKTDGSLQAFVIDWENVTELTWPAWQDVGQIDSRRWNGGIVPTFNNTFRGSVDISVEMLTDAQVETAREKVRLNRKVTVVPAETDHPELWYDCTWSFQTKHQSGKRFAGQSGSFSFVEVE